MPTFQELTHELEEKMGIPLHNANISQAITFNIDNAFTVQIEAHHGGFLFVSKITELPPGTFREQILKNALKANFTAEKKISILAYLDRENSLILFQEFPDFNYHIEEVYENLLAFIHRARLWYTTIESGNTAPELDEFSNTSRFKKDPLFFGFI